MAKDYPSDLTADTNGDIAFVSGDDALAIRVESRICVNQGEWPFNLDFGTPWLFQILGQNVESGALRSILAQRLGEDFEVKSVGDISITPPDSTRKVSISASVVSVSGGVVTV